MQWADSALAAVLNQVLILFTSLERRAIFLEAVFLWRAPFFAALSIADFAEFILAMAASLEPSATVRRTSLTTFFTFVLTDLLRIRLISFCLARFIADL